MNTPALSSKRIVPALAIAIAADAIQIPVNALALSGVLAIPAELTDILVDFIAMGATMALLGFHWLLLPSLVLELIPGLDILPGWTACVAFVIWQRRRGHRTLPIVEVQDQPAQPPLLKGSLDVPPCPLQIVNAADPVTNKEKSDFQ